MTDKCTSFVWSLPSHHLTISTSDLNLRSLPLECGLMLRLSLNHRYDVLPNLSASRMWTVTRICWVKFTSRSGKCFISLMPFFLFFFDRWSFFCFVFSNFPQPRKVEPEPSQGSFLTLPLLVILIVLAVNHNKVRKTGTVYVFIVMMRRKPSIYRLPRVYFLL